MFEQGPRLSTARKLGLRHYLETIALNPVLGTKYREDIDALFEDGHELGLHGGANHGTWQHTVHRLGAEQIKALLRPALDEFAGRYGPPRGFAAPGFATNERVLDVLDQEGFMYSGDMPGEHPVRPLKSCGERHLHYQVPVNVVGQSRVPLIEQGLACGHDAARIAEDMVAKIRRRRFALVYEHPYVAGIHDEVLDKVIERVEGDHDIVTVEEYLAEWKRRQDE